MARWPALSRRTEAALPDADGPADVEELYGSYVSRKVLLVIVLVAAVFIVAGIALTVNSLGLSFVECYQYVIGHVLGDEYPFRSPEWNNDYLLWTLYLPRIVLGIIAGAGLAVCGVAMQSLMNNPLADPYTVGISDGACFGAVAAIVTGLTLSDVTGSMGVVTNAFIMGLVPAAVIILLSRMVHLTPATAILVGVALSYIFSGLETMVMVGTDAETLKEAYLWQIGTLDGARWGDCTLPFVFTAICSAFMMVCSRSLNLLSLGDESAASLGLNVNQFRTLCMILVSVCVAAIVSFCGIIGFVGLVAPHIVRMLIGGDNRFVIPASMAAGALFMLVADLISRTLIAPEELRVGVIVSVIGAPFFLYVILRGRKGYGEAFRWTGTHSRRTTSARSTGSASSPSSSRSSRPRSRWVQCSS